MRTIVDLKEEQLEALARLCKEQKISRAEAVRRAIDHMTNELAAAPKEIGFGLWKHKRLDGRKHLDRLRAEWGAR